MRPYVHKANIKIAIGYPCSLGRKFKKTSQSIHINYNNAGDAFAEEGTFDRHKHGDERKLITRVAKMWNVDIENCWGYTTGGGSEGNLQGLWMAREKYPNGVLYYSDQSHYSIKKMANILKLESVVIPSDETGSMDITELIKSVDNKRPAIVLASVGSTFLGGIDNVEKISQSLSGNEVYIHADAAFFGFVMPFLQPGYDSYKFMDSISISSHKWPGVPFPGGVFISVKSHVSHVENFEEVISQRDVTISGSRNGHTALFLNEFFDTVDLKEDVENSLEMTEYIYNRLLECAPDSNPWKNARSPIIVFNSPSKSIIKKWSLATVGSRSHVCVLNHITKEVADAFIKDMSLYFSRHSNLMR